MIHGDRIRELQYATMIHMWTQYKETSLNTINTFTKIEHMANGSIEREVKPVVLRHSLAAEGEATLLTQQ